MTGRNMIRNNASNRARSVFRRSRVWACPTPTSAQKKRPAVFNQLSTSNRQAFFRHLLPNGLLSKAHRRQAAKKSSLHPVRRRLGTAQCDMQEEKSQTRWWDFCQTQCHNPLGRTKLVANAKLIFGGPIAVGSTETTRRHWSIGHLVGPGCATRSRCFG
jgi:hypothetical protein